MCEQTEMTKKKTASPSPQNKNAPKKMNVPNPLIIIVCIILLGALASYIIPAGSFTRVEDPNTGRMVVDPASFSYVDSHTSIISLGVLLLGSVPMYPGLKQLTRIPYSANSTARDLVIWIIPALEAL